MFNCLYISRFDLLIDWPTVINLEYYIKLTDLSI